MHFSSKAATAMGILCLVVAGTKGAWSQSPSNDAASKPSNPCIEWTAKDDQTVNKPQAERLYREAVKWVGDNIVKTNIVHPPCISVLVGQSCPNAEIKGACADPVSGRIFIPRWTAVSAGTVAQGTVSTLLLRLMNSHEITQLAERLLREDSATFLDYRHSFVDGSR